MKRYLLVFSLLAASCHSEVYIKVGSGISFAESAHVHASSSAWNPAVQGYNAKLGDAAMGEFAIGYEFMDLVDLEVSISNRSTFKYRKFQTPVGGGDSYKREFDLSVTPVLFSANFIGENIPCLSYDLACGKIYPTLGVGVGYSHLLITNFRTTGLSPSGASFPFLSFANENQYTLRKNFTYALFVGLEYNFNECFAIGTGYRWLDAGSFKGPRFIRTASGGAVDVRHEEWKMRFRSNEWFIELKYFL